MSLAAAAAALFAPDIRSLPADARARLALVIAVSFVVVSAVVVDHGWRRRRAELEAGLVLFRLAGGDAQLELAPRAAAVLSGFFQLMIFGVLSGPFVLQVVLHGWSTLGWWAFCGLAIVYVFRDFLNSGIAKVWWGGRLRVCQRGIVIGEQFVPWEEFDLFYWEENARLPRVTLCWRGVTERDYFVNPFTRRRRAWRLIAPRKIEGRLEVDVPLDQRAAFANFLEKAIGGRRHAMCERGPEVRDENRG